MLTIRTQMKFMSLMPLVRNQEGLAERILTNYAMLSVHFESQELLHLLMQPPEFVYEEGNSTQIKNKQIFHNQTVKNNIINQLFNRMILYQTDGFTYMDTVFLQSVLKKAGVPEVNEFMRQLCLLQKEMRQTKQEIKTSEAWVNERKVALTDESLRMEGSRVESPRVESSQVENLQVEHPPQRGEFPSGESPSGESPSHAFGGKSHEFGGKLRLAESYIQHDLQNAILNRLQTEKIFKELGELYHAVQTNNQGVTEEQYRLASFYKISNVLRLEKRKFTLAALLPLTKFWETEEEKFTYDSSFNQTILDHLNLEEAYSETRYRECKQSEDKAVDIEYDKDKHIDNGHIEINYGERNRSKNKRISVKHGVGKQREKVHNEEECSQAESNQEKNPQEKNPQEKNPQEENPPHMSSSESYVRSSESHMHSGDKYIQIEDVYDRNIQKQDLQKAYFIRDESLIQQNRKFKDLVSAVIFAIVENLTVVRDQFTYAKNRKMNFYQSLEWSDSQEIWYKERVGSPQAERVSNAFYETIKDTLFRFEYEKEQEIQSQKLVNRRLELTNETVIPSVEMNLKREVSPLQSRKSLSGEALSGKALSGKALSGKSPSHEFVEKLRSSEAESPPHLRSAESNEEMVSAKQDDSGEQTANSETREVTKFDSELLPAAVNHQKEAETGRQDKTEKTNYQELHERIQERENERRLESQQKTTLYQERNENHLNSEISIEHAKSIHLRSSEKSKKLKQQLMQIDQINLKKYQLVMQERKKHRNEPEKVEAIWEELILPEKKETLQSALFEKQFPQSGKDEEFRSSEAESPHHLRWAESNEEMIPVKQDDNGEQYKTEKTNYQELHELIHKNENKRRLESQQKTTLYQQRSENHLNSEISIERTNSIHLRSAEKFKKLKQQLMQIDQTNLEKYQLVMQEQQKHRNEPEKVEAIWERLIPPETKEILQLASLKKQFSSSSFGKKNGMSGVVRPVTAEQFLQEINNFTVMQDTIAQQMEEVPRFFVQQNEGEVLITEENPSHQGKFTIDRAVMLHKKNRYFVDEMAVHSGESSSGKFLSEMPRSSGGKLFSAESAIQELRQQNHNLQKRTEEIEKRTEEIEISTMNEVKQQVKETIEENAQVVNHVSVNIENQISQISDQVYHRIERRLEMERKRRGY